jgi:hypothetical protein
MAKRKKRKRFGTIKTTSNLIELDCACYNRKEIVRTAQDINMDLYLHAKGWYVNTIGIAMCPTCVIKQQVFITDRDPNGIIY